MNPETILLTVRAACEATTELLRYLQTEQGQKVVQQALEDRTKWDGFWRDVGGGLRKFFTGELFQAKQ